MAIKGAIVLDENGLVNFKPPTEHPEIYFWDGEPILYQLDYLGNVFGNYLRMTEGVPLVSDKTAANTNWTTNYIQYNFEKSFMTKVNSVTVADPSVFSLEDASQFQVGDTIYFSKSIGGIGYTKTYYVGGITGDTIVISLSPSGTPLKNINSGSTTNIYSYHLSVGFYGGTYIINGVKYNLAPTIISPPPFVINNILSDYSRYDAIYLNSSGINILEGTQVVSSPNLPNEHPYTTETIILGYVLIHYVNYNFDITWYPTMIDPFFYEPLIDGVDIIMTYTGATSTMDITFVDTKYIGSVYNNYDILRRKKIFDNIKNGLWTVGGGSIVNVIDGSLFDLLTRTNFIYYNETETTDARLHFILGTEDPTHYYSNGDFIIYYTNAP